MSDGSVAEAKHSKGNKRSYCSDEEKDVLSPKITTPQTRAQVKKRTPSTIPHPSPRPSRGKLKSPVTRTPKEPEGNPLRLQGSDSCARKTRSNIPVLLEVRTTRSRSNTPNKTRKEVSRSRSNTPVKAKKDVSVNKNKSARTPLSTKQKEPGFSTKKMDTQTSVQCTPAESTNKHLQGRNSSRNKENSENSPKINQTPKIPHCGRLRKGRVIDCATPESKSKKSKTACTTSNDKDLAVLKIDVNKARQEKDAEKTIQNDEERQSHIEKHEIDINKQNNQPCALVDEEYGEYTSESSSTVVGMQEACSRSKNVNNTSTDKSETECSDEIKKEVEKVKKRRSTIGQRRSKSFGGNKSLGSVIPVLSFEDQISNIDLGLPQTSKVGHLIDITLREAMRRLEGHCSTDECFSDMRIDLITNSENIGGHTAYKIAGLPLEVEKCPVDKEKACSFNPDKAAIIKRRTEKLVEEIKSWNSLLKERKLACKAAEREFREAKSGETKIDDECMKRLTKLQKNILASKPNYNQYMEEVKMAHEKAFFIKKEIKHTTNIISNFTTVIKAVGDSCYSNIEEKTLGSPKGLVFKSSLSTLLTGDVF